MYDTYCAHSPAPQVGRIVRGSTLGRLSRFAALLWLAWLHRVVSLTGAPRNASAFESFFKHAEAPSCLLLSRGGDGTRADQQLSAIATATEVERWTRSSFASDCLLQLGFRVWPKYNWTAALYDSLYARPLLTGGGSGGGPHEASGSSPPGSSSSAAVGQAPATQSGSRPARPSGSALAPARARWRQCAVTSGIPAGNKTAAAAMGRLIDEVDGPIIRPNALCMQVRARLPFAQSKAVTSRRVGSSRFGHVRAFPSPRRGSRLL